MRADGLTEGGVDKAKTGGVRVKIPSLTSQRTGTHKDIATKCQCVFKRQEARHELQRNVRISFTGQMFEHTEGAVYRENPLRQPVSTLQTACFRSAEQLNRGMAGNSTTTV